MRILFEVIDSPPSEPLDTNKPDLQIKTARLTFDDVYFVYRSDEPVLRGISFTAEPGKLTALVGPSGGGKSTIFNLILRFYDAELGKVDYRRTGRYPGVAPIAPPAHCVCRTGRISVPRDRPREHRIRQTGRQRR